MKSGRLWLKRSLLGTLVSICACSPDPSKFRAGKDLVKLDSPDGQVEAVLRAVDISGTDMVSQPYQVALFYLKDAAVEPHMVLLADRTNGLMLKWVGPRLLRICYDDAEILDFNNRFVPFDSSTQMVYPDIEVVLSKTKDRRVCD
jgi:hypothetical protein